MYIAHPIYVYGIPYMYMRIPCIPYSLYHIIYEKFMRIHYIHCVIVMLKTGFGRNLITNYGLIIYAMLYYVSV